MDLTLVLIIVACLVDGAVALAGGLLPTAFVHRYIDKVLSFAAGTLLGVAFFDMLPESMESMLTPRYALSLAVVGFVIFFFTEHFLGAHAPGQSGHKKHTAHFILAGDALHNFTDGMALAGSFLVSTRLGIITTLAILLHELPQEIGDYAILLARGYTKGKALFALVLVQLTAVLGGLVVYAAASQGVTNIVPWILAISGGGFFYICAADLLPELSEHAHHDHEVKSPWTVLFFFLLGLLSMAALSFL